MNINVAVVNAFIDGGKGGNAAGVVLDADELSYVQKLNIARKIGLSETAFVSESKTADFKLDFFTPLKQIPHCGHATIAAFSYLSQLGRITNATTSKETIDGNRTVLVDGDFSYMEQIAPKYIDIVTDTDWVLDSLGLTSEVVVGPPVIANTGNSFIVLEVKSLKSLVDLIPDEQVISEISEKHELIGIYVFTQQTNIDNRDASARMFAPRYGIKEEAATGMAAGPLACYLYDYCNVKKNHFLIEQGYAMAKPSPSCIEVALTLQDSEITSLRAGGTGVVARHECIEI